MIFQNFKVFPIFYQTPNVSSKTLFRLKVFHRIIVKRIVSACLIVIQRNVFNPV